MNQGPQTAIEQTPILLEDAEGVLEKLAHQELQLVKETEELFKRQVDQMRLIDNLRGSIPNINQIDVDIKRLSSLVESSSTLVGEVCGKFRQIDLAKARVEDSLGKIGDILDLSTCRQGVVQAMEASNYEEAAMLIKRFLSINLEELIHICPLVKDDSIGDKIDLDTKLMDTMRSKLFKICQKNLKEAIRDNVSKDIERFFKIFPMLNEHQEGLAIYSDYLKSQISLPLARAIERETISDPKQQQQQPPSPSQAARLATLYEQIAKMIDSHQPLIETYYGPGHLIGVMKIIQQVCDRMSRRILEDFRNESKLQQVAKIVRSSSLQSATQTGNPNSQTLNFVPSKLDPRTIDNILNEISLIISRSEVYLSFVVNRVRDDYQSKTNDTTELQANQQELYNFIFIECELNHLVQEVGGIYVMLEQFYLNESAKKAILMDQIDVESSSCFVSSMVDDIFFIIKKCTKRAISTKSNEVFCAIINHCTTLLESLFCQVLEERLKNQQYYSTKNLDLSQAYNAFRSGRYLQSTSELEIARAQYFSALNNLDKACDYIQTLRGILDVDIKKLRPSLLVTSKMQDNQMEKSVTCLSELTQLVTKFSSIVNSSLYQLFNALLRNRMKSELRNIISENPDLISVVDNNLNETASLARNLLSTLDKSLQECLTAENHSKLVIITRDFLASSLKTIK